jgi:hypothetical protein
MKKIGLIVLPLILVIVAIGFSGCKEEYDFTDDVVLVVLTNEATFSSNLGHDYTIESFPELLLSDIEVMSGDTVYVDPSQFRAILCLTLEYPSHETVLEYVEILEGRDDIYGASPNRRGQIID